MKLLRIWLMCSFAAALVCPKGYVLKEGECYKKPSPPTTITYKVLKKQSKKEVSK